MDNQIIAFKRWLEKRRDRLLKLRDSHADVNQKINYGAKAKALQETIDYITTHSQPETQQNNG